MSTGNNDCIKFKRKNSDQWETAFNFNHMFAKLKDDEPEAVVFPKIGRWERLKRIGRYIWNKHERNYYPSLKYLLI